MKLSDSNQLSGSQFSKEEMSAKKSALPSNEIKKSENNSRISNYLTDSNQKYAIRFGLGAIKSVGLVAMENAVLERKKSGKFKDIFDFARKLDPKFINKKSIEALAKSGAFDGIAQNRHQIANSFEVLSSYANEVEEEANSNQMNLFGGVGESKNKPILKLAEEWKKSEKLQKEFEAFGFFLNEHPLDDFVPELKKRGIVFSSKIEEGELADNSLLKMSGVVASSKHRSGSRGRFAYLNISDPFGIYEATIFDEAIITANRDLLNDGCEIVIECLVRKDEGGSRIMIRNVKKLDEFIKNTKPSNDFFEDIKIQPAHYSKGKNNENRFNKTQQNTKNNYSQNLNIDSTIKSSNEENKATTTSSTILITISEIKAVLPLKTVLLQKLEAKDSAKETKIFLNVKNGGKNTKIELPEKYYFSQLDLMRLRNLHKGIIFEII